MTAKVYCPTRGFVFCETAKALEPYEPSYVRDKVAIHASRNWIVRDFLQGEGDVLVMVDDDVVPPPGFVERLAQVDADVVAGIVPITGKGKPFFGNAFHYRDGQYVTANPQAVRRSMAVACDAVGTGCVLIHRRVLTDRRMTRPFDPGYDDAGVIVEGEDLAFCRRARTFGFRIVADWGVWCEHFTAVHANGLALSYVETPTA